jgi:capsular exopolysaccharide synthesis family protein
MANVYGEEYIAFRQSSDRRQLQEAIDKARAQLEALPPAEAAGPAGAGYRERLSELETTQALLTGSASSSSARRGPHRPVVAAPAAQHHDRLLLGGVLGLGMAFVRERLDRTIRTEEDLEQLYGAPVLMRLPRSRKLDRSGLGTGDAAEAEAFRILRANLRYFNVDGALRSILVSSPTSGDGKSTVARGLAATMASLGDNVVLVEADLHKARSPTLGHAPDAGLSSVLTGTPLNEAVERIRVGDDGRHLALLPAGPTPPNPVELLESGRMANLLVELEARYDVVLIDSPALAQVSDARPLVAQVSGVLIVSSLGQTTRASASDFRKQLYLLEGNPLGTVANLSETSRSSYYY